MGAPVYDFTIYSGKNIQCNVGDKNYCEFDNIDGNGNIDAGFVLDIMFFYHFHALSEIIGISVDGSFVCINYCCESCDHNWDPKDHGVGCQDLSTYSPTPTDPPHRKT